MVFSLRVFFKNLFRPIVTSMQCVIYENGKQLDLSQLSEHHLESLLNAIDDLFQVDAKSPYWFESNMIEQKSFFQKPRVSAIVTCYCKDMVSNGFKKKYAIPIKYRKKMFDTFHRIRPEPVGTKHWPIRMEVKFYIPR